MGGRYVAWGGVGGVGRYEGVGTLALEGGGGGVGAFGGG